MDVEKYQGMRFYKYLPLQNLERFLDIVVKKHLYAATYLELNDPMEGKFDYSKLPPNVTTHIFNKLSYYRICSVAKKQDNQSFPDDYLMWSHYADGQNGCCLEIEFVRRNNKDWLLLPVSYNNTLYAPTDDSESSLQQIISQKSTVWNNEHEYRAIRNYGGINANNKSKFVAIKIHAIYFGQRNPIGRCRFIKKIVNSFDPNIHVYKVKQGRNSYSLQFGEIQ